MHFLKQKKSVWEGNILYGSNQMKRQNCEDIKKKISGWQGDDEQV